MPPTLEQQVFDLLRNVYPGSVWLRAERSTVVSGSVTQLIDIMDATHVVSQSSDLARCSTPAASGSTFGGNVLLSCNGAQSYNSNRPPSDWNFMVDGSGGEYFHVGAPTTAVGSDLTLHSSCDAVMGSTQAGTYCSFTTAGDPRGVSFVVSNGTGTPANGRIINSIVNSLASLGTPTYVNAQYREGDSPEWVSRHRGTTIASGSSAAGPGSASAQSMQLFRNYGGSFPLGFNGKWRESIFVKGVLTAPHRAIVRAYIQQTSGIAP